MNRYVFCSKCNSQMLTTKRVHKESRTIYETIDPHICPEVPLQFTFTEIVVPTPFGEKSVQKTNKLSTLTNIPGDRRSAEHIKDSSAPINLLEQIKRFHNSIPENSVEEEPDDKGLHSE